MSMYTKIVMFYTLNGFVEINVSRYFFLAKVPCHSLETVKIITIKSFKSLTGRLWTLSNCCKFIK